MSYLIPFLRMPNNASGATEAEHVPHQGAADDHRRREDVPRRVRPGQVIQGYIKFLIHPVNRKQRSGDTAAQLNIPLGAF